MIQIQLNKIIDQMFVEFEYCDSKEVAHNIEKEYFETYVLPLNIIGNNHFFSKELKKLRKESKTKAISRMQNE